MNTVMRISKNAAYDTLYRLGLTAASVSFFHTACAVRIAAEQPELLTYATKTLYPAVAKEYGTNWRTVERSIRRAVHTAWLCNPELLCELAMHRIYSRPTASEFVAILAAHLAKMNAADRKEE